MTASEQAKADRDLRRLTVGLDEQDFPKPGVFEICDYIEPVEGHDLGTTWNGWACPAFMHGQALVIAGAVQGAYYDAERDQFCFPAYGELSCDDPGQEWDCFPKDERFGLYPIGAFCWTWEKVEKDDDRGDA